MFSGNIPSIWDSEERRILIARAHTPGSIGPRDPGGRHPDSKAYCRVLEFAVELGISTTFHPFTLHDIKGG